MNLTRLITPGSEISLAKKVLNGIENNCSERNIRKALMKYEKVVNKKGHKYHSAMRIYVEDAYESFLDKSKNSMNKNSFETGLQLLEKYRLQKNKKNKLDDEFKVLSSLEEIYSKRKK